MSTETPSAVAGDLEDEPAGPLDAEFYDVETHQVVVELPDHIEEEIARRMEIVGRNPEEDPEKWFDYALDHVDLRFAREVEGE
ncbi:hypothetical protein [Haloarchaeobius sp. DT45]|uniref:hypothetical protein n=1 Tax=Haloarchaeobius sp. DT45 TaxID=3446116 RepID=UPI003F6D3AA5